jgi:LuxR family maltose regulon positive regulatory protein
MAPLQRTSRRPPLAKDYVARAALLSLLEKAHETSLTLICTPAGYGKSTLLSAWLEASEGPWAWLSLETRHDELRTLASVIVSAIDEVVPEPLVETRSRLSGGAAAPESLAASLAREIPAAEGNPLILVLDDYHAIHNAEVHEFVMYLLRAGAGKLHLAVATRSDPPLPLARLRARGQLTEIRQQDLRFSTEETAEFLTRALERGIDPAVARVLEEKTEGWPVGLRLGALSLRRASEPGALLDRLPSGSGFVTDYLVSEVLAQQPPIVQEYLLRTSVLDRFCAPLCDAMLEGFSGGQPAGILDGDGFLALAERANVFLIPLDEKGRWYRYHHLFRDLLLHQLENRTGETGISGLRERAAGWLEEAGFVTEAIEQAIRVGPSAVVPLVARHRHDLMNREEWHRVDLWLRLLPAPMVESEPELLLLQAWTMENRHRYEEVLRLVHEASRLLKDRNDTEPSLLGEIETFRALESYLALEGDAAIRHARSALEMLGPEADSVRGYAVILLALSLQMIGDLQGARAAVHENMRPVSGSPTTYDARLVAALTVVDWIAADLGRVEVEAREYRRMGVEGRLDETLGMGNYYLGAVAYEKNGLARAEEHLSAVVRGMPYGDPWNLANCGFLLAATLQNLGRDVEARRLAEDLRGRALEVRHPELLQMTQAFEAELALRQNRAAESERWADSFEVGVPTPPYRWFNPHLTYVRARLAQETPAARVEARAVVGRLRKTYTSIHADRALIEALCLQALVEVADGMSEAATESVAEALRLAEPGGLVRVFVDLGRPMRELLRRLEPDRAPLGFVGQILSAFASEDLGISGEIPASEAATSESRRQLLGVELTNREAEILTYLADRLSNKEIAARLHITPGTVKTHTVSLYRKLGTRGRREAVAKAKALGLLPPG